MTPTILVATWTEGLFAISGEGRRQEIVNQPVRGLAQDGHGGALAIAGRHSLRRRGPGADWNTLVTSNEELSCCLAVAGTIYTGTEDARLLWLDDSGVLEPVNGFDNVAGRETWYAGSAIVNGQRMGPPLGIRSVAANSNGSVLFANVHVGGIPRSVDGGKTWEPTIDIHHDVHEVRAHPEDPELVVAACATGLGISRDAGATWTIERGGLHAAYCSAVAFSGGDILVSAATDHFASDGRIYRRPAGREGKIAAVQDGLPAWFNGIVDTGCIATWESMVVVADRSGALYQSTDFGRSWTQTGGELPAPSCVLLC